MIKFKLEDAEQVAKDLKLEFKDFSIRDLLQGMNVEAEHGSQDEKTDVGADKPLIAGKIALSHLLESPNYYKELNKMEKNLERKNEVNHPKVYYCRHIEKGVAQYDDGLYLVKDEALHKMKKSMAGVPAYVQHQNVDLSVIREKADGYVAECFYNELDGWFWAKFICVSDAGREAIEKGWSVSNSYIITEYKGAGVHHNVLYVQEVIDGYYTHLAIVPDPRYENAFIVDEEGFKSYNKSMSEKKELQNNKTGGNKMKFKLFKNKKEEVKEIDKDTLIEIENGKQIKVADMIDTIIKNEKEEEDKEKEKLNMDGKVKVGEKEMTIKELVNKYMELKKNKSNEGDDDEAKKKEEEENKKKNEEDDKDKDKEKENAKKKKEQEDLKHFEEIKNAIAKAKAGDKPKTDYEGNQFIQTAEKGQLSLLEAINVVNCKVDTSETGTLVPGTAVKIKDIAGPSIVVEEADADTDAIFGFIPYSVKKNEYIANDWVKIALNMEVMWMEAGAAIARGAYVEYDVATVKVITSAGVNTVVGIALDKAAADADLIRVLIATPLVGILSSTITGTLTVTVDVGVGNDLTVVADCDLQNDVDIGNDLEVTGATSLLADLTVGTTLDVTGLATLAAACTVGTTLGVTGAATLAAACTVGTTLGVTGVATFTTNISVGGLLLSSVNSYSAGAGALPIDKDIIFLTTGGAEALTLADGVAGQRLKIVMVSDGGDGTVTPNDFGSGTTITFDNTDSVDLISDGASWWTVGTPTAAIA
jgi:hypothetical protein